MRLDKYLKVSRLIKRRTVANEACDAGKVLVNGKVARDSTKPQNALLIEWIRRAFLIGFLHGCM